MNPPASLLELLRDCNSFLIATHFNPDADGIGSALALSHALRSFGKKTALVDRDPVPYYCNFMPGIEEFMLLKELDGRFSEGFDALVLVDCNDLDRIGAEKAGVVMPPYKRSAVIDHHVTERSFGDVRWVETDAAATGMMIFNLFRELGVELTKDTAVNLYAAIAVDTGNFKFDNTSADVLAAAASLAQKGAEPSNIYRALYEAWSDGRFRLFVEVLNTMELHGSIAMLTVTKDMLSRNSAKVDDTESFVEFPRIADSVRATALVREIDKDFYKVSLRSKGKTDISTVAAKFNGGGHKNAAGCIIKADLPTVKNSILKELSEVVQDS